MFCGEMICWKGACCRVKDERGRIIGGVNQHAKKCSNGFVFVFRIATNKMFAWNGVGGDAEQSLMQRTGQGLAATKCC